MVLRGMAVRTRQSYIEAVRGLAKFYRRRPDAISVEEVQAICFISCRNGSSPTAPATSSPTACGSSIASRSGRTRRSFVSRVRECPSDCPDLKPRGDRAALGGHDQPQTSRALDDDLQRGAASQRGPRLKVSDIDSQRMTLRVDQGKGAKDRYTLLSKRLLSELRRYWQAYRPREWLFPLRDGRGPSIHARPRRFLPRQRKGGDPEAVRDPWPATRLRHPSPGGRVDSTASSVSSGTGTSRPRCAISTWRNATWKARLRRSIS